MVKIKITGDIFKDFLALDDNLAKAVTLGIGDAGQGLKGDWRQQILSAGLGPRVANTIHEITYPKQKFSKNAAALVFSKAPQIMDAFNQGALIRAHGGFYLAIPTENAPKRGTDGKKIHPGNFPGELQFVRTNDGRTFLVAINQRPSFSQKTGQLRGFKQASKRAVTSGFGVVSVVMFILVRQVSLPKKLDVEGAAARWTDAVPSLIDRYVTD